MNILDVYNRYRQMPMQIEHHLKVAAVGEMICGHINLEVNKDDIVAALLLHDMGNIIKFNLAKSAELLPDAFGQQTHEYWEAVKRDYVAKYRSDEHAATIAIAKELGAGARVVELVSAVGFEEGVENAASSDFDRKICAYSDMRVKPTGVTSLEDRIEDLHRRYNGTNLFPPGSPVAEFDNALRGIERQIFEHCSLKPEDITEQAVGKAADWLKEFELKISSVSKSA